MIWIIIILTLISFTLLLIYLALDDMRDMLKQHKFPGLNYICEDPSDHYHITTGKEAKNGRNNTRRQKGRS